MELLVSSAHGIRPYIDGFHHRLSFLHVNKCLRLKGIARCYHLEVSVVWAVFEAKRAAVLKVRTELRCGGIRDKRTRGRRRGKRVQKKSVSDKEEEKTILSLTATVIHNHSVHATPDAH